MCVCVRVCVCLFYRICLEEATYISALLLSCGARQTAEHADKKAIDAQENVDMLSAKFSKPCSSRYDFLRPTVG